MADNEADSRFRYGNEFNAILASNQQDQSLPGRLKRWWSKNKEKYLTLKYIYMVVNMASFLLLFLLGTLMMAGGVTSCSVPQPDGTCCHCLGQKGEIAYEAGTRVSVSTAVYDVVCEPGTSGPTCTPSSHIPQAHINALMVNNNDASTEHIFAATTASNGNNYSITTTAGQYMAIAKNLVSEQVRDEESSKGVFPLLNQVMPTETIFNNILYGSMMIINSIYGMYYVVRGVQSENPYLLVCVIITQVIELFRGIWDIASDTSVLLSGSLYDARIACAVMSATLFVVSCIMSPFVYKSFGWRIFRLGGAKRSVGQMYKSYQRFRAVNRLDVQSSTLLFFIIIFYQKGIFSASTFWVYILLIINDTASSRFTVKYIKQEDARGVILNVVPQFLVFVAWLWSLIDYGRCYGHFESSRHLTEPYLTTEGEDSRSLAAILPGAFVSLDFMAQAAYAGTACEASRTRYMRRAIDIFIINFTQAVVFRLLVLYLKFVCCRNFGKGLKRVFYKYNNDGSEEKVVDSDQELINEPVQDDDTSMIPQHFVEGKSSSNMNKNTDRTSREGSTPSTADLVAGEEISQPAYFIPKKRKKATTASPAGNEDASPSPSQPLPQESAAPPPSQDFAIN